MTSRIRCTVLKSFFAALERRGVAYCVVGNAASVQGSLDGDVDIVAAQGAHAGVEAAIGDLTAQHGGAVVQVLRHERDARYYVIHIPSNDTAGIYLKLDICSDYVIEGRQMLPADWLLAGRHRRGGFYRCAPDRGFAYYLLKKIHKGHADAAALRNLKDCLTTATAGCRSFLARHWKKADVLLIEGAIAAEDWRPIEAHLPELRRGLAQTLPRRTLRLWAGEQARRVGRLLKPTGFVVAVLGPDGAGKSTLLDALAQRLAPAGRRSIRYHFMPPLRSRPVNDLVITDPHAYRRRGSFGSIVKLFYLVTLWNLGWLASVWMPRRRSTIVFFDRYYHDILVDPIRYRDGAPPSIVRSLGRLVPKPDLFLILDVTAANARLRKTEVSSDESERQFLAYRALPQHLDHAYLVDGNRSPDEVAAASERIVVAAMARKLRGQYAPT